MSISDFDFSRRVVVDTNILLNSTFVASGLARRAMVALRQMGTPTYVPLGIEAELTRRARHLKLKYALAFDPVSEVSNHISELRLMLFPPPAGDYLRKVSRHDEVVARSARQLGAVLMTDDIELIFDCRANQISAVQPWEVARSYRGPGELPPVDCIARCLPLGLSNGYVFGRVEPGDWAGMQIPEEFVVADVSERLRISYEARHARWRYSFNGIGEVTMAMPLKPQTSYVVCGGFAAASGRVDLQLRAGATGTPPMTSSKSFTGCVKEFVTLRVSMGHAPPAKDHWNGYISDLVVADGKIARDTFRWMALTQDLSPNPHDGNRLEEELAFLQAGLFRQLGRG